MSSANMTQIKFMTYNVWSCEHVAVFRRIEAVSELISRHDPDVIFLQLSKIPADDVFFLVYEEFPCYDVGSTPPPGPPRAAGEPPEMLSAWVYEPTYTVPGKVELERWGRRLRAATCLLPGPTPSEIGSVHRRARAGAFLDHFDCIHEQYGSRFMLDDNVVLGGDLGWDDDLDGPIQLPDSCDFKRPSMVVADLHSTHKYKWIMDKGGSVECANYGHS
ncbi:hypothetical protein QOZ80_7BG0600290 [Eleusine coracana subsp. coracana]|nr:hypothetical protein QOZ80_7BG0600290 [Eleusine coracana subsp. coracana]